MILITKRLKSDFAWVLAGNGLYSACQWAIVVALAKLGNPEKVGEYALGMAVSAPVILFANFQLRALLASELNGRFSFSQYLTFRFVSLSLGMVVVAGTAVWSQPDRRVAGIIILIGFAQSLEYLSETYYGLMQKHERLKRISASLILKGPLSLAALCGAMYVTHSLIWAIVALTLGRIAVLLAWDSRLGFAQSNGSSAAQLDSQAGLGSKWGYMPVMLRMAFPLGIISMLVSLNSNIPRYFLEVDSGSAELGIFSALASLLTAGNLVVSAFGQCIFVPVAQACAAADRSSFRARVTQAVTLGGALGTVAVIFALLFGREILTHIFRPEYSERAGVLVWVMVAGTVSFIASGLGYVITAAQRVLPQIPLLIASALAAAGAAAWWIPGQGLAGAASALLISAFVQLIGTLAIIWRIDRQLCARPAILPIRASWHRGFEANEDLAG